MKCPFCGYAESKVTDSRPTDEGESIRRRRECLQCQRRFTTYEIIERVPIMVVKKDGTRQAFDKNKIISGITKACEKRPVTAETIYKTANDIEQDVYNSMEKEISSTKIGELVMLALKDIDEVAYVRFASVYRQFKDINTFLSELNKLLGK